MNYSEILEMAQATANRLGIKIKNPALIIKNMTPATGITTILSNEEYTLWIDKHYIAYGSNFRPEITYVFADREHINEELRSVKSRIREEKLPYVHKILASIQEQLSLAKASLSESGNEVYFFTETEGAK